MNDPRYNTIQWQRVHLPCALSTCPADRRRDSRFCSHHWMRHLLDCAGNRKMAVVGSDSDVARALSKIGYEELSKIDTLFLVDMVAIQEKARMAA